MRIFFPIVFFVSGFLLHATDLVDLVRVETGRFFMGSSLPEDKFSIPLHQVDLAGFLIGRTEITQSLYQKVMGVNPSFKKGEKLPVDRVSWYDAIEFCNELSRLEGLEPAYLIDKTSPDTKNRDGSDNKKWKITLVSKASGYRLPTEAQWEFAARGGTNSKHFVFAGSNTVNEVAWYYSNSSDRAHEIATKAPNELGIHDMCGNAFEWCFDWFAAYEASDQRDPTGPNSGDRRVLRGGSWSSHDYYRNVGSRDAVSPAYANINLGIRVVRPL